MTEGDAVAELFDIGGDVNRLNRADSLPFAPTQEFGGATVGRAGIRIADIDGEEFEEAPRPAPPCFGDEGRQPPVFLLTVSSPIRRP